MTEQQKLECFFRALDIIKASATTDASHKSSKHLAEEFEDFYNKLIEIRSTINC